MTQASLARPRSLVHLIAWLSVCLLVVGWGPSLEPHWRRVWANVGMFGLAASVALVVNERVQTWRTEREHRRQFERRWQAAEHSLERSATHVQASLNRNPREQGKLAGNGERTRS